MRRAFGTPTLSLRKIVPTLEASTGWGVPRADDAFLKLSLEASAPENAISP